MYWQVKLADSHLEEIIEKWDYDRFCDARGRIEAVSKALTGGKHNDLHLHIKRVPDYEVTDQ
jgi:hypothetical protein